MTSLVELAWAVADATNITLNVEGERVRGSTTETVDLSLLNVKVPLTVVSSVYVGGELFLLFHSLGNLGLVIRSTKDQNRKTSMDLGVIDLAKSGSLANMLENSTVKSSSDVMVMLRPFMVVLYRKSGREPFRSTPMKAA